MNFSRTVWITFHCRGTTSSVSVMSSPIFTIRDDPQQLQLTGAEWRLDSALRGFDPAAWWPQWDWGADPDSDIGRAWQESKVEWAGIITLRNLRTLNAHGLVDRG